MTSREFSKVVDTNGRAIVPSTSTSLPLLLKITGVGAGRKLVFALFPKYHSCNWIKRDDV